MTRDRLMDLDASTWNDPGPGPADTRPRSEDNAIVSLLHLLRRNGRLIALTALAVGALAYGVSSLLPERYESTASLLFQQSALVGQLTGFNTGDEFGTVEEEGATNVALVSSRPVATETARSLGGDYDFESVSDAVAVKARPSTSVVDLTASAGSAAEAARIANTYVRVFLENRSEQVRQVLEQALRRLERELDLLPASAREGAPGKDLTERIGTLRTLLAVRSPNVEPIQQAEAPVAPTSPRPKRNALLGLLFGLVLGVALAALRQQADQRIREPEDLESLSRRPLLGVLPRHPALARPVPPLDLPPDVLDAFRLLEVRLRYRRGARDTACIMVTSAVMGEGKTVCAWHLAVALAASGKRTAYIEADLRRRSVADRWHLAPEPGLADVLRERASIEDATQQIPVSHSQDGHDGVLTLDVITAGEQVERPTDLFDSPAMRSFINTCIARYDAVIIDTPPISYVADAVSLLGAVSGVVIVGSLDVTPRRSFERLLTNLEQTGAPIYGVIANGVRVREFYGAPAYGS